MAYISKIKVPGVTAAYLIKDNEGRLMIAPEYSSSTPYSVDDYYVKDGKFYAVSSAGIGSDAVASVTTVGYELKSIKKSIASPMNYIGVTKTILTDGSKITTLEYLDGQPDSLIKTSGFVAGDVVLAPAPPGAAEKYYEYVWNGSMWSEFGSTKALGKMAYADKASGSTTIIYNKSQYTGIVEVNEYSEGASKYLNKTRVIETVSVGNTTSASSVSKTDSRLDTTSVSVVGETGAAVTNITTTKKGLDTTKIYGVKEDTVEVSKVVNGTTSVQVGATQTTSVVTRTGTTAPASGSNPFVGAQVDDNDECLSWIEEPIGTTDIRGAVAMEISVPEAKITNYTGIAKKADAETTVATGALIDKENGDVIITSVTGTTESFAKKAEKPVVVATGTISSNGAGADVNTGISISPVTGLVTGITYTNNDGVLVESTSGEGAIKVLSGITSVVAIKDLNLTRTDITDKVDVAITVTPVGPTVSQP